MEKKARYWYCAVQAVFRAAFFAGQPRACIIFAVHASQYNEYQRGRILPGDKQNNNASGRRRAVCNQSQAAPALFVFTTIEELNPPNLIRKERIAKRAGRSDCD